MNRKFTLAVAGETLCTQRISCYKEDRFLSLVKILRDADISCTNLETRIHTFKGFPMPIETMGLTQTYQQADPFVADELKWMGFNILGRSNNHGMDFGPEMIFEETSIVEKAGFVHAGQAEIFPRPRYLLIWKLLMDERPLYLYAQNFQDTVQQGNKDTICMAGLE